jgi:CDP-diacylglycerol--glycerol-3-phosphate 3-phosphatidyltransferase
VDTTENIDGKPIKVKSDWWTLSNAVSFSRVVAPIPLALMGPPSDQPSVVFTAIVIWIIFSDYLDGYLARLFDQRTELGKVLDPLADKICAAFLFLFAVWIDRIPEWFLAVVIGRDVLILLGSLVILRSNQKVAMSVMSGKITINVLALYWLAVMYFPGHQMLEITFMSASIVMMVYSTAEYAWRYFKIRQGAKFN